MTPAWAEAIERYLTFCLAAGHSPGTLRLRRHYLGRLASLTTRDPFDCTRDDVIRALAHPAWKPETRRSARSAVRSFYAFSVEAGLLAHSPAERLPSVRIPATAPRPMPEDALTRVLAAAPGRERLMVLLAAYAGLRRAEVAAAAWSWFSTDQVRITGKGGRVRVVPLHPLIAAELEEWPQVGAHLFPGADHGHLSPDAVGRVLSRLLGPGWTAHTLRHRFATGTYAAERDLLAVGRMLGHSRPETTARYTAVPDGAARAAVMALSFA